MKVVLFDIDHTLMHSPEGANGRSSSVMFRTMFGVEASEDSVEKVGMTEWGVIEKVLNSRGAEAVGENPAQHDIPEEAYKLWADELAKECVESCGTIGVGMRELVESLSGRQDIKLGLLTGNSYWRSEVKLKSVGLDDFFRERTGKLVGAFGNEARTREGLLSFAQDRLVYDHDKMIIIDDSLIGAQMAKKHDVPIVLVATGSATAEELHEYSPYVFSDLGEERWKQVLEIVERLGG